MSVRAEAGSFAVGARLGWPLGVAAFAYLALTPHGPNRPLLIGLAGLGAVMAALVTLGPVKRRIERGNVEVYMEWWCASFVVYAIAMCLLDDGLGSPFIAIFFVSVAFAATALPRRGVVLLSALNLLALGVVGLVELLGERRHIEAVVLWGAGLIATAVVGATISSELSHRAAALRRSQEDVVHRLARVVEYRDNDTGGHVERMSRYSALVAEALGWGPDACRELELAAALHDVGKVAVPDSVLLKPGPLTSAERATIERHCQTGYEMLAGSGGALLDLAATIALTHHEHYDGSGYPAGLRGEEIPIAGRIVSVADVFDAMTSDRVYKKAMGMADALDIIRNGRGTQLDPQVVDAFTSQLDAISALYAGTAGALAVGEGAAPRYSMDPAARRRVVTGFRAGQPGP